MCTAATYRSGDSYFGRNLDLEYSYDEQVVVAPRHFSFEYRNGGRDSDHYAIIGMAYVAGGYPLYYDAINERGLGMAGLNFPDNCEFREEVSGMNNLASFEMIPFILSSCSTVEEARKTLADVNITNAAFSPKLPPNPLHWMIADAEKSIVVEQTKRGLTVYDNPVGVMTNNPTFDIQLTMLANYRNVTADPGTCTFGAGTDLHAYSRGMGGIGLPGDLSSASRFAKVAFTRANSVSGSDEASAVSQFFHILGSVEQQRGCCRLGPDKYEITIYSSCCNLDKGIYYYKTYENSAINAINMHHTDLAGTDLARFDLVTETSITFAN